MSYKRRTVTLALTFIWLFIVSSVSVAGFFTKEDFSRVTFEKNTINNYEEQQDDCINNIEVEETRQVADIKVKQVEEKTIVDTNRTNFNTAPKKKEKVEMKKTVAETKKNDDRMQIKVEQKNIEETTYNDSENTVNNEVLSTYKGYETLGKIEIPKTGVNLPILSRQTIGGMDIAPCCLYSTGSLNYNGKTLICGHNLKDGKIFSNNNKLQIGDKIYITTLDGKKVEYVIYSKEILIPEDVSYFDERKSEKPQIILSSCTDDEEKRIVIIAKAI